MKKLFLILMLLITVTLNSFSEDRYYIAKNINIKIGEEAWGGWEKSNVSMVINFNTRHIQINSPSIQIIDYTSLTTKVSDTYTLYFGSATDYNYKLIRIHFQMFNNGNIFLTIEYDDCMYSYDIIEIDSN